MTVAIPLEKKVNPPIIPPPPPAPTLALVVRRPVALAICRPAPMPVRATPPPAPERSEHPSGMFGSLMSLQRHARREMMTAIRVTRDAADGEAALELLAAFEQYLIGEEELEAR